MLNGEWKRTAEGLINPFVGSHSRYLRFIVAKHSYAQSHKLSGNEIMLRLGVPGILGTVLKDQPPHSEG